MKVEFNDLASARVAIRKIQNWIDATSALTENKPKRIHRIVDPDAIDDAILEFLGGNPNSTTPQVWEGIEIEAHSQSTVNRAILRLQEAGEVEQSNNGKRNRRWKLTPGKVVRIRAGEGEIT